jgi:DNA helicase-4
MEADPGPPAVRAHSAEPGRDVDLSCLDIVSVSTSKALLWHTVEIRTRGRTDNLSSLSGDASEQLAADLHAFINTHLFDLMSLGS